MEADVLKVLIEAITLTWVVATTLYAWWNNRTRADRKEMEGMKDRSQALEYRINLVEKELMHAPGQKEIGEVHYRVDQVGQSVKGIEGTLGQMQNTLTLIQTHLLQDRK